MPVFIFKKQYKQEIFQDEKSRIEALGGVVLYMGTWRVNGNLAVSRAIGNHGNIAWENRVQTKDWSLYLNFCCSFRRVDIFTSCTQNNFRKKLNAIHVYPVFKKKKTRKTQILILDFVSLWYLLCPWSYVILFWQDERARIERLGGFVLCVRGIWRVNAILSVARALGK